MAKIRLNLEVSEDLDKFLENLANEEGTTKTEIVRRGLSVMKAFRQQIQSGNTHIGFTDNAKKLDTEMVGILDSLAYRAQRAKENAANGE